MESEDNWFDLYYSLARTMVAQFFEDLEHPDFDRTDEKIDMINDIYNIDYLLEALEDSSDPITFKARPGAPTGPGL